MCDYQRIYRYKLEHDVIILIPPINDNRLLTIIFKFEIGAYHAAFLHLIFLFIHAYITYIKIAYRHFLIRIVQG